MPIVSKNSVETRRPRLHGFGASRTTHLRAPLLVASLALAACSAAPKDSAPEGVGKITAALDRPGAVFTPTTYTIALSEVDVVSAVEPTNNTCNLTTPDTGYVDWAELGVQVDSQTPMTAACTLNDANGHAAAPTGTKLVKCGTLAANNSLLSEGQPLAISFNVTSPNDTIKVGLALDNIESTNQAAIGNMSTSIPNGLATAGDSLQLVGSLVSFGVAAAATTDPITLGAAIGVELATAGGFASIAGDLQTSGSGTNSLGTYVTSCAGGLLGNPVQGAFNNGNATYDAPPPDTMWINFTPAQLDNMIAQSVAGSGFAGCPPAGCNGIDYYPTMTSLGPPRTGCDGDIDVGFPGGGPAYDYGCSSSLHIRLTITRNWATGPAASSKSADMAVEQFPNVLAAMIPDTYLADTQMTAFTGIGGGMQYDGVMPQASVFGSSVSTTPQTIPALVSRTADNLDAFYVANSVLFTSFTGPQSDYAWQTSALSFAPTNAAVTAVARSTQNLDAFFSSTDGNVYDTFWSAAAGQWNQVAFTTANCIGPSGNVTTNSAPCAGSAVPGGGIAAVALDPGNVNVFYIGTDGGIWNTWWAGDGFYTTEICGPSSPYPNQQRSAVATPGGSITAVARTATNIDVYYLGTDGTLWTSSWYYGGSWGSFSIPGSANLARAGTPISAVARQPGAIDVVFETPVNGPSQGGVEWASWTYSNPWTFNAIPMTTTNTPNLAGADAISIVAPTSFSLELFYLDYTGNLETLSWSDPTDCVAGSVTQCSPSIPTDFPWGTGQDIVPSN
jgi:hypothetical protein